MSENVNHNTNYSIRRGRWIEDEITHRLSCSECSGVRPYDVYADEIDYWPCNFCPTCGADMRIEEE
jgi:rRNA maturation endonuclease Nob1